ncbi:MAG: sigma-54-dependent Fis family transcriptional regulator [Negativicutes bacterium]|nr:sigma-54-dependent Fis family transcriptional regulator [Negativicutes bacterium]
MQQKALAWKTFVNSGELKQGIVSSPIAESWKKCSDTRLNPTDGRGRVVLEQHELRQLLEKNEVIIQAAKPFMQNLYQFFRASSFVVVLTDVQGYILELFGDSDRIQSALDLVFVPGANWRDDNVGTNAIGSALSTGQPIQVSGCEHFCLRHHCWTCSAAPITDQDGNIMAVLDISGPAQASYSHTLGMVVAAAEAISMQLRIQQKNNELTLANQRLTSIFNTMSDGVVLIDSCGIINEVNAVVKQILGGAGKEVVGRPIERIFGGTAHFTRGMLNNKQPYADVEVMMPLTSGTSHCLVSGEPLTDERGKISGGVIILRPIKQVRSLVNRFSGHYTNFEFGDIIGNSAELLEAVRVASLAATSLSIVLLQGESGTGKELFAQAIHHHSARSDGPFIAVNCGAIPRELISSELFGYEEGAFTGAKRGGRPGKFELAAGGTLFLDEIADMPLEQQVALLRVLQEKKLVRIGGERVIPTDVRVICATNKNLLKEVERGIFRQELYYRLNVISITVPPLRERGDDITLLFQHIINKIGKEQNRLFSIEARVLDCLRRYGWPGNVRELHNVAERAVSLAEGETIALWHLPPDIANRQDSSAYMEGPVFSQPAARATVKEQRLQALELTEQAEIAALLHQYGGNISRVAKRFGVARTTIYRKMERYGISNVKL